MFEVKICETNEEKENAFKIREEVFVNEQGFALEIERDEYDEHAVHAVGYENGIPVACGRLAEVHGKGKLGRIAVLKEKRKNNYGLKICECLIAKSKEMNLREMYLHSQIGATGFYKKLGFVKDGEIFLEEEAEHIKMIHILKD